MSIFLTLLLGHLLADFPLQTNWLARMKKESRWGVTIHVCVYVAVTALLMESPSQHIFLLVALGATHWLIDTVKMSSKHASNLRGFVLDQAAHVGSLLLATTIVTYTPVALPIGLLTESWLYWADLAALVLSIMVMAWVWACSTETDTLVPAWLLRWTQQRMLEMSQRAGFILVGSVAARLLF